MKRCLSLVLALIMLLCLLPASALAAPAEGEAIVFSGDGDWQSADKRVDNTKSYVIHYDVKLPAIAGVTKPDTWADDTMLVIRNEAADHYIKIQIQSYCNGSGQYQVAASAQQWVGNNWSASRPFQWSGNSATPITDVHMELSYDAASSQYSWKLSDRNGNALNSGAFPAEEITGELKGCSDCALTFYRNPVAGSISNASLRYVQTQAPEQEGQSASWSGDGDWLSADLRIDNTKSYLLSYDVKLPNIASVNTPDSWVDDCMLVIRNEADDHYIKFQTQAYCSGSVKYQIAGSAQQWGGNNWTASRPFEWSQEQDTPITDIHMEISYNASNAEYSWELTTLDGAVLNMGTFPAGEITEQLKGCNDCALTFYRNNTNISISNTKLVYTAGEPAGPAEDPTEPGEPICVVWEGAGDRIISGVKIDNTKSYTIKYDLKMTEIFKGVEDGAWADNYRLEIVNGEEKFYLEIQQCKNGGYMLFVRGSDSITQNSAFSSGYETPVSGISVKLTYSMIDNMYNWIITDKDDPDIVHLVGKYGGKQLSDSYKAATECSLEFVRRSDVDGSIPPVVPEDFSLTYGPIVEEKEDEIPMDPSKTPADFGWNADNGNYVNWQTDADGTIYEIHYAGSDSQRIYKEMIKDPNNFTLTLTVQVLEHRGYIEVLGTPIEIDCHGGNGNQICEKFSGTYKWLNAIEQTVDVTVARSGGGKMKIMFKGKGNPTPMNFEVMPNDESQPNVVLGVYDNPGAARFSSIKIQGVEGQNVGDYGWHTDETDGAENFAGWASLDGVNIDADRANTVGNSRIWKDLISDQKNFAVRIKLTVNAESSAYVKLLGQTLELDARGGNGNQVFVKLNGNGQDWLAADGCEVDVLLMRRGDKIIVSLVGNEIATYEMTPSEESENLELGIYAGKAAFNGINVREPAQCLRPVPFGSVVFAGSLSGTWQQLLCEDIALYQNGAMKAPVVVAADAQQILATKADLIIIALSPADVAGKTLEDLNALLSAVKAGMDPNAVLVLTGLPHGNTENLGQINAYLRAAAEQLGVLYADLYSAMGGRDWTVNADGSLSAVGNALVEGEIMEELLRHCTCLAVNSSTSLRTELSKPVDKTQTALDAFKNAADREELRIAVETRELGLNRKLYNILPKAMQDKLLDALLVKDRSSIASYADADALFTNALVELLRAEPVQALKNDVFTIVTVGDSVTQGTAAVNEKTDAWPIRLLNSFNAIAPGRYKVINKGIAGTRMCTITDNGMFPPAKDTVDAYIVSNSPDLLIVSYGFNDMNAGTTLDEFITTYRAYVREIQAKCPDTIIMLCNVYPDFGEHNRQKAMQWSAAVKALAEELGCIYSSAYEDVLNANWLLADGVHPTNAGYRVMAQAHLRTLNLYLDLSAQGGEQPEPPVTVSPSEYGWKTDDDNFAGWTVIDENGIRGNISEAHSSRVWKELEKVSDFTISLNVQPEMGSRGWIRVCGVDFEINAENGNGNQVFLKHNGNGGNWVDLDWFSCTDRFISVIIKREAGGKLQFTVYGKDNDDPLSFEVDAAEENSGIEFKLGGTMEFKDLSIQYPQTPDIPDEPDIPTIGDAFVLPVVLLAVSALAVLVLGRKKAAF